jgi:hypothetical protein
MRVKSVALFSLFRQEKNKEAARKRMKGEVVAFINIKREGRGDLLYKNSYNGLNTRDFE